MPPLHTFFSKILKKSLVRIFLLACFVSVFFLTSPQKSYAIAGVGDIVHDPIHTMASWIGVGENGVTSAAAPVAAGAGVTSAVGTTAQATKSYVLDTLANSVAKAVLRKITADTVQWINTGFKGNPAFVTNPNQFFMNIGDQVTSDYILSTKSPLAALCAPFRPQVRLALVKNYLNANFTGQCTITKIVANVDNFTRDFSQGGWAGWLSLTQTSSNNPFGAYRDAAEDLSIKIGNQKTIHATDLMHGNGFLSAKKCPEGGTMADLAKAAPPPPEAPIPIEGSGGFSNYPSMTAYQTAVDAYNNKYYAGQDPTVGSGTDCAYEEETVTPGSAIAQKLFSTDNLSDNQLLLANSINQILSALVTQMVSQVFSSVSGGLRGLSQSTASNPQTLVQQLQQSATAGSVAAETSGVVGTLPPSLQGAITGATSTLPVSLPSEAEIKAKIDAERAQQLMLEGFTCTDPNISTTCVDTSTQPTTVQACTDPNDPNTCTTTTAAPVSTTRKGAGIQVAN